MYLHAQVLQEVCQNVRASHEAGCHGADPSIHREVPLCSDNSCMHNLLHVHLCYAGEVCLCTLHAHFCTDSIVCQQPVGGEELSLIQVFLFVKASTTTNQMFTK